MPYRNKLIREITALIVRHGSFILDLRSRYFIPDVTPRLWLATEVEGSTGLVAASRDGQGHAAVNKHQRPI